MFSVRTLVSFDLGMADAWNTTLGRLESSLSLSHVLLPQERYEKPLLDDEARCTRRVTGKPIRRLTKPLAYD